MDDDKPLHGRIAPSYSTSFCSSNPGDAEGMLSPQPHFTRGLEATKEIWDLPKDKYLAMQEARVPRSHFESSEEEKSMHEPFSPAG